MPPNNEKPLDLLDEELEDEAEVDVEVPEVGFVTTSSPSFKPDSISV